MQIKTKKGKLLPNLQKNKRTNYISYLLFIKIPSKVFYSPLESSQKELHNKHTGIFKNKSTC